MGRIMRFSLSLMLAVSLCLPNQSVAASEGDVGLGASSLSLEASTSHLIFEGASSDPEVVDQEQPSLDSLEHVSAGTDIPIPGESSDPKGEAEAAVSDTLQNDIDPSPINDSSVLISKYQIGPGNHEFVEIFNNSLTPVDISGWRLEYLKADHDGGAEPTRVLARYSLTLDAQAFSVV